MKFPVAVKRRLLFGVLSVVFIGSAQAQVNIGSNTAPNADAVLEISSGSNKGLLLPRVALTATNSLSPLANGPFSTIKGMAVYNTASAGSGSTAVTPGLYYCDGTQWVKLVASTGGNDKNVYDGDGTLTGNRTVSLADKNLNFSATTGSVTFNAGVAVGASAANSSADLTLGSTNKGFLPNRVSLSSTTDASTVAAPATGLIVYNTNAGMTNGYGTGLYINTGTSASPVWGQLAVTSPVQGTTVAKIIYTGTSGDQSKTVTVGNFIFRFSNAAPGASFPQMALTASQNLSVYLGVDQRYDNSSHNGYEYNNSTVSYTTANYGTFQNAIGSTIANYELNVMHIVDVVNNNYYRVTFYISGAGSPNYTWSIVAEKF